MLPGKVDAALRQRLEELESKHGDTVRIADIAEVVESMMATLKGDVVGADLAIYAELESLARYIQTAKTEIARLRPDQVKEQYLPAAADQLDAIVEATAEATHTIMDATEIIEGVMENLDGENSQKLMDATTRIYEACGFQDITGQRITKVVNTLKDIEERIDALVAAFGSEIEKVKAEQPEAEEKEEKKDSDEKLVHGPQLPEDAKSQAEVDALLASFD
ncbi:MAG: protein phosphatase CheZ [Proteobacteria bacterium]|nr:protein phosphatase CheZ [Pseudomonadota bacterium]MCH7956688.1 protein phosphatase CheZ [Pseudomonadota bacterium]MCH8213859.1 protein phosphatase CheZ [Pseudomonadota bacterium]